MSSQQKNLVYALWQEVPKLVYASYTVSQIGFVSVSPEFIQPLLPAMESWKLFSLKFLDHLYADNLFHFKQNGNQKL